jgi:hypothetical protein
MVKHHQEKAVINHQRVQTQQRNDALEARHLLTVLTSYHNINGLDPIVHGVVDRHAVEAIHEILFKEQ